VRVCGDLARFVDEDDLALLTEGDVEQPVAAVLEAALIALDIAPVAELEQQAA
jgi:hypothetical protein